ncbi:MAG: putative glycoside hydrolase [Blautia sp.]|nr:putative glycoside hydrolase [Blautia sp.]
MAAAVWKSAAPGGLRKGMVIKMARRRRRTYSYQRFSYQSSRERERKRKRRRIAVLSVMAVLLLLGAGFALGMKLLRTDRPEEVGAVLTGGPVLAEDVPGVPEADGQDAEQDGEGGQPETAQEIWADTHLKVKGIYVTGPMAGSGGFQDLLTLVDETELNAMVIDVKNDEGQITYAMELESAGNMGACVNYIRDMEGLMAQLKEHGVYTIARIVCFKDPCLAKNRPELALTKPDKTPIVDANGLAWVNPYEQGVWEYLTDVALQAAEDGFDEIQFDYVRFPIGEDADQADYGVDMEAYPKQQAITDFLAYATERLDEKGIPVTADVFGTIIGSETDVERVGQDYVRLGQTVRALCPMVYPSHYGNGVFGLAVPDAHPYETVLEALTDSREELAAVPEGQRAVVRPWLQAFTATWVQGHISYNGDEIRSQIQAVYDAGYEEWFLWNATNRYTADGLLSAEESGG